MKVNNNKVIALQKHYQQPGRVLKRPSSTPTVSRQIMRKEEDDTPRSALSKENRNPKENI